MHILKRSLLLLGVAAFTLTACKDDDPAAPTIAVTGVTITPATGAEVTVGLSVQLSATVQTSGTGTIDTDVTWAATPASVATVGATTGLVTGVTAGTATITATSVADPDFSASTQVTVNAVTGQDPAVVSLSSVTTCFPFPGCTTTPVNLAGAAGQIEATLNIDTGDQQITSALVEMGSAIGGVCTGAVVWTEAARQNYGTGGAPDGPVTLSFASQEFDANFVPRYLNGDVCIRGRLIGGNNPTTANTIKFTLVNPDVVYFNATIGTTGGALGLNHTGTSAVGGGNTWWRGGFTFRAHPVLYSGVPNVTGIVYTSTACGAAPAATGPNFSATFTCTGVENTQNIANSVTINYAAGYTLTVSPTTFMTAASPGFVPGRPVYPAPVTPIVTREDNVAPSIAVNNVAFNDNFDQMWINAAYTFIDATPDFVFTDGGVGVNAASRTVKVASAAGVCPAVGAGTIVDDGADLAETLTSDGSPEGHRVCATGADVLGNTNPGSAASNFFGVDKGVPTSRLAGSTAATPSIAPLTVSSVSSTANTTIFGDATPRPVMPATDVWGLEAIDTRAGFNQNVVAGFPAVQTLTHLAPTVVACPAFTNPLNQVLTDNFVRTPVLVAIDCGIGVGYYTYSGHVVDRAGNSSAAIVRNFARDHLAAPVLTSISPTTFYQANAAASFTLFGSDDLEIIEGDVSISYPNTGLVTATIEGLTYPLATVGGAARWDALLNNNVVGASITVPSLLARVDFTCTGAGAPYASCTGADLVAPTAAQFNTVNTTNDGQNPDSARAVAFDVASNVSNAVATGILTVQTQGVGGGADVAQQWVGAGIDLLRWRINTTAGGTVIAEHMATTSITAPYFDSVILGRADVGATEIRICTTFAAPVLTDNGVNRFWTYTGTKPTGTAPCAAGGNWYAIGVKAGAALITIGLP